MDSILASHISVTNSHDEPSKPGVSALEQTQDDRLLKRARARLEDHALHVWIVRPCPTQSKGVRGA